MSHHHHHPPPEAADSVARREGACRRRPLLPCRHPQPQTPRERHAALGASDTEAAASV